jgi:tRNA modification GTPase
MVNNYDDTIFSLATAVGRAATAMVRISGPRVNDVPELLGFARPEPKIASLRTLKHQKKKLDQSIVLFFSGPESYTGEDVMELHLHGGRAVIEGVYSALSAQEGFRFAENGEFSKRAVMNGRIDLTEAEGINDLINAETEAQRDQGLNQLEGALRLQLEKWSKDLKRFGAYIEAYIDFPDEEIPENILNDLLQGVEATNKELKEFVDDDRKGEILRSGLKVAVIGPPNVGKSSFVNWLTKRDIAITSEKAGTTRDIVEAHLDLGGYPVTVADTAGIRASEDTIEQEGIRRARGWAESADLRVLVLDPETIENANQFGDLLKSDDPVLINKADQAATTKKKMAVGYPLVSVKTGYGLERALSELTTIAKKKMGTQRLTTITQARHRARLNDCLVALKKAHFGLQNHADLELIAEDFRSAIYCIGRITGHIDIEDLLDVVFKEFCIGK